MTLLPYLQELQSVHDHLRTIERDLTAFPSELERLHKELGDLKKRKGELEKALQDAKGKEGPLTRDLKDAQALESQARQSVKTTNSKVQYTAAIRELDARERQVASIQKPLADLVKRMSDLAAELERVSLRLAEVQEQFDVLHGVFLSEHENQVTARGRLQARKLELEERLPALELTRFNRLLGARQGKALTAVDGSTCLGCRTKLRIPLMTQLREQGLVTCESCQRYLHLPAKP